MRNYNWQKRKSKISFCKNYKTTTRRVTEKYFC